MGKVEDRHSKGGWVGKEDLRYRAPHTQEPEREQIAVAVKLYVAWGRAFFSWWEHSRGHPLWDAEVEDFWLYRWKGLV